MAPERSVSITQLATLEEAFQEPVQFIEGIQPERDISDIVNEVEEYRKGILESNKKLFLGVTAVTGITAVVPAIFGRPIYSIFAAIPPIMYGIFWFAGEIALHGDTPTSAIESYNLIKKEKKVAARLDRENYVFANQLSCSNLLPSQVASSASIYLGPLYASQRELDLYTFYAVKEGPISVKSVALSEIGKHIGSPVIVTAKISSGPSTEDMKIKGGIELEGRVGIFPFTAIGNISGEVYGATTHFRICDPHDPKIQIAASFDYVPPGDKQLPVPYQLRRGVPGFETQPIGDRNDFIHFLNSMNKGGIELLFFGTLDKAGHFHAEGVANPATKETFYLAVYQPTPKNLAVR